uniref:Auxin response factor n=1 Tax=Lagerstroemia indica TaxID=141186 RepID=A0A7U1BKJ5_9MYRT|nr:ARF1-like protein [Lagerstroemia indica]
MLPNISGELLAGRTGSGGRKMSTTRSRKCGSTNRSSGPVDDELYDELWQLCAGRQFYLPEVGERVFYFPQGHVEQVQAYTNQEGKMEMPIYNVPSKILCEVVHVLLQVEAQTDEVFAQITLLPQGTQYEPVWFDRDDLPVHRRLRGSSFSKTLTASDTSTHGGFSIPKRHADDCFPPLDMSMETPAQALVMKDLQGKEWHFRQIYRGQPRRHLITTGWSAFVTAKKLVPGDTCIFIRGENGDIRVGIRRSVKSQKSISTSVISGHNMHHGILASAFHATSTGTLFTVYCRPWTNSASFVIPVGQYMKSIEKDISTGRRFRMLFENEECVEQWFGGTVIAVEDIDPIRWPGSRWRCLKVEWDSLSGLYKHPERVSPWNIEVVGPAKRKQVASPSPEKRARPPDPLSPGTSNSVKTGPWWSFDGYQTVGQITGVFQGQEEKGKAAMALQGSHGAISMSGSGKRVGYSMSEMFGKLKPYCVKGEKDGAANKLRKFRLFGVDIVDNIPPAELPSLQVANPGGLRSSSSSLVHPTSPSSDSDVPGQFSRISLGESPIAPRSCVKVFKHGISPGRLIDLTRLNRYDKLVHELDRLFGFRGSLVDGTSRWQVTYTDHEGDLMLVGDYPWQEFVSMVQRVIVSPKQDSEMIASGMPRSI